MGSSMYWSGEWQKLDAEVVGEEFLVSYRLGLAEAREAIGVSGAEMVERALDLDFGGERPSWWTQRRALCWDIPERIVEEAAFDYVMRCAETFDAFVADAAAYGAVADLMTDPEAPQNLASPAQISDEQI